MNYAHYALQKLHIPPGELEAMGQQERAFIYASIDLRVEEEKKAAARMKSR